MDELHRGGNGHAYDQAVDEHGGDGVTDPPEGAFVLAGLGLAGADERGAQVGLGGHRQGPAAQAGTATGDGGVGVAGQRQVDDGEHRLVVADQGGGDGPVLHAVDVVDAVSYTHL